MARVTKTVSLNDETDKALLDKLESVPNISEYIKKLIVEDIEENNSSFTKSQKEEIEKIILSVLSDKNFTGKTDKEVDKEQIDAIDDLFKC
ncbi:CopG family transcriptional regulator [Clostridium perfringens]